MEEEGNKKNSEFDLMEAFKTIWGGRKTIFLWAGIFTVLGLLFGLISPTEYSSDATLLIENGVNQNDMSGLVQQLSGLAGIALGNSQNQNQPGLTSDIYPDVILSTPFLLKILDQKINDPMSDSAITVATYLDERCKPSVISIIKHNTIDLIGEFTDYIKGKKDTIILPKHLVTDSSESAPSFKSAPLFLSKAQLDIVGDLADRIQTSISAQNETEFSLSVQMQNQVVATQVANILVHELTLYVTDYRTKMAKNDLKCTLESYEESKKKYVEAQMAYAQYTDRNKSVVLASVVTVSDRLQADFNLAFTMYSNMSQQVDQAKIKVQEQTPVFTVMEPPKLPQDKKSPKIKIIMIIMFGLGGFIGIMIVLLKLEMKRIKEKKEKIVDQVVI